MEKRNELKVSLVVPVYNGADYIVHFLQIALGQTLSDIEIILVDDCSTDDWLSRANAFLKGREDADAVRVRFLSTPVNGGPGAARNIGLAGAVGKYVCFVDCDDEIAPDYCESLYCEAEKYSADMVCCDALTDGKLLKSPDFTPGVLTEKGRAAILLSFVTRLWTYMFCRKFLIDNNIHFPQTRSSEDTAFVTLAWLKAGRASHLPKALYNYIPQPGSLSRRKMHDRAHQRLESMRFIKVNSGKPGFAVSMALKLMIMKKGWLMVLKDFLTTQPDLV
ncbi:MAG: glycosyltransferase [Bacteroidales bacterium]|nr:glycosyltransferase [Candidatus Cacconaster merdequi]